MKSYVANATSDWGAIFYARNVQASTFGAAIARAGRMAHKECRKRPKQITITIRRV